MPTSPVNGIKRVILKHESGELVATVVCEASPIGEFAFYIIRNGERIHTQWYSPNPALRIGVQAEPGLYQVKAFFRLRDGKTIEKFSNPAFLYPTVYSLGEVFKIPQAENRT